MSTRMHVLRCALLLPLAMSVCKDASAALPQRTFVASTGDDVNAAVACKLVAPCRSFLIAIGQTAPGGEVIVLDSAGYGPVTITQAVSLIAPAGVYAGVSVAAGAGVTVNAGAGDTVVLRGLSINGLGGANGIVVNSGAAVDIGRVEVSGFTGDGIQFNGGGELIVRDSIVRRNGGNGLTAVAADSTLMVQHSTFDNNLIGVVVNGPLEASIADSSATGNPNDGFVAQGGSHMQISDCRVAMKFGGATGAVRSDGAGTIVQAARCQVTGHSRGFGAFNGAVMNVSDSVATGPGGSGTGFIADPGSVMNVERSTATNFVLGLSANSATVRVSNSTTYGNDKDFNNSGGTFYTRQNNTAETTFGTITPLPPL